jgi:secreted protein with Ig-like and vWFA domain
MEKFALGMLVGGVGGALLVANNYKMRALVKKTQEEVRAKFDQMVEEKIETAEKVTEEIKEDIAAAAKKAEKTVKKAKKAVTE